MTEALLAMWKDVSNFTLFSSMNLKNMNDLMDEGLILFELFSFLATKLSQRNDDSVKILWDFTQTIFDTTVQGTKMMSSFALAAILFVTSFYCFPFSPFSPFCLLVFWCRKVVSEEKANDSIYSQTLLDRMEKLAFGIRNTSLQYRGSFGTSNLKIRKERGDA
jgi:hypothetical protein